MSIEILTAEELAELSYKDTIDYTFVSFDTNTPEYNKFRLLIRTNTIAISIEYIENDNVSITMQLKEYIRLLTILQEQKIVIHMLSSMIYINSGVDTWRLDLGSTSAVYDAAVQKLFAGVIRAW